MDLTPVVSSSVSLYFCVSLSHSLWCFETRMDSHSLWTPRMWPLGSLSWWITHKGWMVNYPAALNPQVNIFSSLSVYVCTRAFWTVLSLNTPLLWPQRERSGVVYEEFWSFKSSFCWRSNENFQPAVGIYPPTESYYYSASCFGCAAAVLSVLQPVVLFERDWWLSRPVFRISTFTLSPSSRSLALLSLPLSLFLSHRLML